MLESSPRAQESVLNTGENWGHTASTLRVEFYSKKLQWSVNKWCISHLFKTPWLVKNFLHYILLLVNLILLWVVTEQFSVTRVQSLKLYRWDFFSGENEWLFSIIFQQKQVFSDSKLFAQVIRLLGSFHIKSISFSHLSVLLWLLVVLCPDRRCCGLSRLYWFDRCVPVWEGCTTVPHTHSLDGHFAFATVYRNAGCWGESEMLCSCLRGFGHVKAYGWGSAVNSCKDDSARGDSMTPEGTGQEGSAHVVRVSLRSSRKPQVATLLQISPAPRRDYGNQRLEWEYHL